MNRHKKEITYKVYPFGITGRVAIFSVMFIIIPMVITGVMIEKRMLLPEENIYLGIPIFFLPLIIPFSKLISNYLINKDLRKIEQFCEQIKSGNYACHFDLPNQKDEEDPLLSLLRNLTWMAHSLEANESSTQNRFGKLQSNLGKIQKQAFTDSMTGLYNRRYLSSFIINCKGTDPYKILSMIYIDCDKFKQVNDTMGHAAGDDLLVWLATCLKETGRQEKDIPLRLGGDEFAMLVMDITPKEACEIALRLRKLYHRRDVYQTSLSIGIANIRCNGDINLETLDELTKNADRQAYIVKQAGGNNVCMDGKIHDRKRKQSFQEDSEQRLAYIDPLTKIPNRYLAKERFSQALKRAERNKNKLCMLFLDLDDFKTINDSLGHFIGDKFLQHIVGRIKETIRAEDSLCRLGGDEFLILIENISSKDDVPAIVAKISDAVRDTAYIEDQHVTLTSSIGITLVPEDGNDFDNLCKRADLALTQAKQQGKNRFCFFDPAMAESVNESLAIITDLREAVKKSQFELYLQPQFDLKCGTVRGAETLIRWNHPSRGLLSPEAFIELAERSNQIIEIGHWVIDEACRICTELIKDKKELVIAVNVSPIQLKDSSFADSVLNAIRKHGLDGRHLELEFTESILLQNDKTIIDEFSKLRRHGVKLAIDDFGTGYSNLSYIKNFDITKLKIDRSFIKEMTQNRHDKAIVDAIIRMSQSLGIETVAEGIEKLETIEELKLLGGKVGQGFYWQKPIPFSQFIEKYTTRSKT